MSPGENRLAGRGLLWGGGGKLRHLKIRGTRLEAAPELVAEGPDTAGWGLGSPPQSQGGMAGDGGWSGGLRV